MARNTNFKHLLTGVGLLLLTASYSPVILLTLAPVYGSAPSSIFHSYGVAIVAMAGWFLKKPVQNLSKGRAVYLVPVLAFWLPTVQYILFQKSSSFGNPTGPIVTEILSYYPLVLVSVACARKLIQSGLDLDYDGDVVADHVPLLGSYVVYSVGENFAKVFISECIGYTFFLTRAGMHLLLAILYSALIPSKWLLLAIPSILFSFTSNVHLPLPQLTGVLNTSIQEEGYTLLARQDSSTGYISVLENMQEGYRIMRCDHSILGGEWTKLPSNYNPIVRDPVYAVFVMLEAIRLVESDKIQPRADEDSRALVIGLGVGSTPAALIHHGIETTVVEIDPVVHQFATQFFHLPHNHIAAIEDATEFVERSRNSRKYDYIVHDVFTGGAEPANLFTIEFLSGLHSLLKPDGVIAINYAGDITLYPAKLIVRTIQSVFPSCRIFRESPSAATTHFTNMVIFCAKGSTTPLRFRSPTPADFLGSKSRESYLLPKHEINPALFQDVEVGGRVVLRKDETGRLAKFRDRSAIEHWGLMRGVLPDRVWENW